MINLPINKIFYPVFVMFCTGLALFIGWLIGWYKAKKTYSSIEHRTISAMHEDLKKSQESITQLSKKYFALPDMAKDLGEKMQPNQILISIMNAIMNYAQAQGVLIFLLDKSGADLKLEASLGLTDPVPPETTISIGQGMIGQAAETLAIVREEAYSFEAGYQTQASKIKKDTLIIKPKICVPLICPDRILKRDKLLGVLGVYGSEVQDKYNEILIFTISSFGSLALENAILYDQVQKRAVTDGLTGLYNRRFLQDQLKRAWALARRTDKPLSLFLFDIDHFKNYNDTNGHLAGDRLLSKIGQLLLENTRLYDFAARYGGEEFLVTFVDTDKLGAFIAAERIRQLIENMKLPFEEKQPLGKITISGGVACYPHDGDNPEEILKAADKALYEAKESGRNNIKKFTWDSITKQKGEKEKGGSTAGNNINSN